MKFVLASYGSRGDVEPCAAVSRELLRRGHDVCTAVPPDMVGFVESIGLEAVAFGPDLQSYADAQFNHRKDCEQHNSWTKSWRIQDLNKLVREQRELLTWCSNEINATLTPLANGADLLFSVFLEESAANIAEYYDIPFATLHTFPARANGQRVPSVPSPLMRTIMTANEWAFYWQFRKKAEDAQRRELGLPKATGPASRRIAERGSLEIQAYDQVCFPGLAAEWAKCGGRRPFVGSLTLELTTDADEEVTSWIAAGTPPIFFSFGSTPVESPADTVEMIAAACAQLGERALVCGGWAGFSDVPHLDHVKVVSTMNYPEVFPACRAVVHHGGSGTTAASLRAGVPTLILWTGPDQAIWATQVKRLKVGTARLFSATTRESLVADLRTILAPQYLNRARELATQMTKPADSVARTADLVEKFARVRHVV